MAATTERNKGQWLAILTDGQVVLVVAIPERISDKAAITFPSKAEAENFARALSAPPGVTAK